MAIYIYIYYITYACINIPGWWFGTFFMFPYIEDNHPNWIFFGGFETTNQIIYYTYNCSLSFAIMVHSSALQNKQEEIDKIFRLFDTNGNGFIVDDSDVFPGKPWGIKTNSLLLVISCTEWKLSIYHLWFQSWMGHCGQNDEENLFFSAT